MATLDKKFLYIHLRVSTYTRVKNKNKQQWRTSKFALQIKREKIENNYLIIKYVRGCATELL